MSTVFRYRCFSQPGSLILFNWHITLLWQSFFSLFRWLICSYTCIMCQVLDSVVSLRSADSFSLHRCNIIIMLFQQSFCYFLCRLVLSQILFLSLVFVRCKLCVGTRAALCICVKFIKLHMTPFFSKGKTVFSEWELK